MEKQIDLAIMGGSGVCDPNLLKNTEQRKVYTPFGATSDLITIGDYAGHRIAFLPRHGASHTLPPHLIPYQANLWALRELGVKRVIAPCAVGSLQEDYKLGDLVVPDQFIDWTKGRDYSTYNGGVVAHISMADPFCTELRQLFIDGAKALDISHHDKGTTVTIEGPRFSTRAESMYFKNVMKGHIIGMTLQPECTIARELRMCYVSLAMVTDFDAWKEDEADVTHSAVEQVMKKNVEMLKKLLLEVLPKIPPNGDNCQCSKMMDCAVI